MDFINLVVMRYHCIADLADSSAWSEQFAVLIHSTWDVYRMLYHQVTYSLVTYTYSISWRKTPQSNGENGRSEDTLCSAKVSYVFTGFLVLLNQVLATKSMF
jgi:hypothetical protein